MPFEQGSVSFRLFFLTRNLPDDAIERFAGRAAPPLDKFQAEATTGWVTGRHLLDRDIRKETAWFGNRLRLTLRHAERKIPTSLLRAEVRMEEMAVMAAEGRPFVDRKTRADIRRQVIERLLPQMPPQITGTTLVLDSADPIFYADASTVSACDRFTAYFQQTTGINPIPLTPDAAANERKGIDTRDWNPVSFSESIPSDYMDNTPGRDFLTWLWYVSESRGGRLKIASGEDIALLIEGPLFFAHEGDGAHETVLRRGEPGHSAEAKTCLVSGKKLRQAKLTLALGDEMWPATLHADEFTFRGLKLPRIEQVVGEESRFEERMRLLDQYRNYFLGLFDVFVEERENASLWRATVTAMHDWIKHRPARA